MALRRDVTYSGRFTPATTERPQGGFKNRTSPTSEDGSYLEEQWLNDIDGFFASALMDAGVVPNGNVDEGGNSQLYDAVLRTREVTPLNDSWNGFFTRAHITQLPSPAGVPATSGSGGTAYSADDEWSIGNFASGGTISLDDDGLIFSQGIYKLFTFTAEQLSIIDVTKVPVYIVGQDGSRHFVKHNGTGVVVTKPDTTTLKVQVNNAILAELGITKVFSFFVTATVGFVQEKCDLALPPSLGFFEIEGLPQENGFIITNMVIGGNRVIIQNVTFGPITDGGSANVPWITPFPNAVFNCVASPLGLGSNAASSSMATGNPTVNGVNVYNWGTIQAKVRIFAIGY
ncbi:putative tail-fiber protein [Vibrio phage Rostov M3]|uniref:Putative tail-fiber protein n=1 Tax=Vibrio phage Rostov M3 TaxID=2660724 RepID=A0A5Q2WCA6_9CAUD|nr:putative tail-fiber protein [Vibrio phage Rostov M3]